MTPEPTNQPTADGDLAKVIERTQMWLQSLQVGELHLHRQMDVAELIAAAKQLTQSLAEMTTRLVIAETTADELRPLIEQLTNSRADNLRLRKVFRPIQAWWIFVQAQHQLENDGKSFDEDTVALSFMGSGASMNVTVKHLNDLCSSTIPTTNEDKEKQE